MNSGELALAFLLLTAPPGIPEAAPEPDRWPAVQAAVTKLAIDWEILDPRETRYIMAKPEEFGIDVNLLRRRQQDLRDVPRLLEVNRLPDRNTAVDLVQFNRAFRKTLESRRVMESDRSDDFLQVIRETDQLYAVWDAVRDARCDFYYVTVRRQALRKVKDVIGDEAWDAGQLPPAVPTWRFAQE